jgi:Lar family restriction alleviation protein
MTQVINEIKSCPFCGRIWLYVDPSDENHFVVRCRCGATGPVQENKNEAIKAWNTRDQHLLWNPFRLLIRFPKNISHVDFRGNLESLDLATILQTLATASKTGILQVCRGYTKSVICLKDGNIVAASDSSGLRLGQILYKHGMISRKRLKESLNIAKKSGRMLGEVLLSMRYIEMDVLKEVVRQQVQEAVLELFFWKQGFFEYRDCIVEFDEEGFQDINTMEIVMESVRRMDEWDEVKKRKEKILASLRNAKLSCSLEQEEPKKERIIKPPVIISDNLKKKKNIPNSAKLEEMPTRVIPDTSDKN